MSVTVNITLCLKYIFPLRCYNNRRVLRSFIITKFGSVQVLSKLLYRMGCECWYRTLFTKKYWMRSVGRSDYVVCAKSNVSERTANQFSEIDISYNTILYLRQRLSCEIPELYIILYTYQTVQEMSIKIIWITLNTMYLYFPHKATVFFLYFSNWYGQSWHAIHVRLSNESKTRGRTNSIICFISIFCSVVWNISPISAFLILCMGVIGNAKVLSPDDHFTCKP